ncbi:MAG: hypothetical protein ACYSR9_12160 [Planctomycetota bacterium]
MKKKAAKKKAVKKKMLAVRQGEYKVGNKKPPKEYQFQPGETGNPKGPRNCQSISKLQSRH